MPTQQQMATMMGPRRKRRSPYLDMIRGQYGRATESVIQQKAERLAATQRAEDIALQKQGLEISRQQTQQQIASARQRGREAQIGTGISAIQTGASLYGTGGTRGALGSAALGYGVSQLLNTKRAGKRWAAGVGTALAVDVLQGQQGVVDPLVRASAPVVKQAAGAVGKGIKGAAQAVADWWPW